MAFKRAVDTYEEDSKAPVSFVRHYEWFKLAVGEQRIYRFVTEGDEIISAKSHQSIPTKAKPTTFTGKWPKSLPAVCRYDPAFDGVHSDCYVCDFKVVSPWTQKPITASARYWALAVEREEYREKGVIKGYRDVYVDYPEKVDGKETGKTLQRLKVVVINLGGKNFFGHILGMYSIVGSITNQDFIIKRSGEGKDTTYTILGAPGSEERDKKGVVFGKYTTPELWAERYGEPLAALGIDLEEIVANQASDDRYGRFFDPRVSNDRASDANEVELAMSFDAPANEDLVDPENLQEMLGRVRQFSR